MRDGYRIIDADRHVIEPIGLWRDYLEPAFRDQAPYYARLRERTSGADGMVDDLPPDICVNGEPVMNLSDTARRVVAAAAKARGPVLLASQEPAGHLEAMDRSGIDAAVMFPTYGSYLISIDAMEPALAHAYGRAYNDWLRDFCSVAPDRLIGAGLIARHDPGAMAAEARRIASFGWSAVVLRPNPVRGRSLGDPAYAPFWRVCEELSLAVVVHEGTHARVPSAGADRFQTRFAMHACSHPMEQMMAYLSLLEGGVFERHPGLRFAFLEAGCGWVPYWLWRLDEVEYKHLGDEAAGGICARPSAYFKRQCLVGIEPDEPLLPEVIRHLGEDRIAFGTDFPHLDHDEAIVDELLTAWRGWPRPLVARLLGGNAARFFRLIGPGELGA